MNYQDQRLSEKRQCSSIITFFFFLMVWNAFSIDSGYFQAEEKKVCKYWQAGHLLDLLLISIQAWIQPPLTIKVKFQAAAVLEICSSSIFPLVPGMK